jgi:hypothetical protein
MPNKQWVSIGIQFLQDVRGLEISRAWGETKFRALITIIRIIN